MATVHVRFDGLCVSIESTAPEVLAEVEEAFRAMVADAPRAGGDERVVAALSVKRLDDGYEITKSGEDDAERGPLGEVRRAVRYRTTRAFLEARADRFWVHAAAARWDGRGVLLPGSRGSGKSTLVTTLVQTGWRYLSDEVAPLDMATDQASPFPLTPEVRMGPRGMLAPEAVRQLTKRHVELDPSAICRESVRITEVVFVRFVPGVSATLESISPGEAALQLLDSCLNFPHLGSRAVGYAAVVAGRLAASRLTFGDAVEAARLLAATDGRDQGAKAS